MPLTSHVLPAMLPLINFSVNCEANVPFTACHLTAALGVRNQAAQGLQHCSAHFFPRDAQIFQKYGLKSGLLMHEV